MPFNSKRQIAGRIYKIQGLNNTKYPKLDNNNNIVENENVDDIVDELNVRKIF